MCGRLDQHDINKTPGDFAWAQNLLNRSEAPDRWDVPLSTYRPVLNMEEGKLVADDVFWSYHPAWAAAASRHRRPART